MSRRRRRHASGDSLELLLDTICNTFGGIVFIALLIVLLLRETAARPSPEPAESVSPDEIERLAGRLEAVTAELTSLRTAKSDLDRRAEAFAPTEVRDLLERRNSAAERVAALRAERDRKIAANASTAASLRRQEEVLNEQMARLPEARSEVNRLETVLATVRKAKIREIRNPVLRDARAFRNVPLMVRYGRMYLWHRYGADGERLGLNTEDFVIVEVRGDTLVTHPDPTKGIPLAPGKATVSAIRDRLRPFRPSVCYVEVVVRPDSFEQFATLRDALIAAGYEYRLMPTDGPVLDRGGSGGRVQ